MAFATMTGLSLGLFVPRFYFGKSSVMLSFFIFVKYFFGMGPSNEGHPDGRSINILLSSLQRSLLREFLALTHTSITYTPSGFLLKAFEGDFVAQGRFSCQQFEKVSHPKVIPSFSCHLLPLYVV